MDRPSRGFHGQARGLCPTPVPADIFKKFTAGPVTILSQKNDFKKPRVQFRGEPANFLTCRMLQMLQMLHLLRLKCNFPFSQQQKIIIIIRARNKVAFKTEQMEHLEHPANFLTRNNKIFCPQLSRQNIFNMVHLDDLPKICDFSSEFFKNSCPKFLTCQSGTPRTVYFRIQKNVAGITPHGLFSDTKKCSRYYPKRSIFQRHLKTTIIIIIH